MLEPQHDETMWLFSHIIQIPAFLSTTIFFICFTDEEKGVQNETIPVYKNEWRHAMTCAWT